MCVCEKDHTYLPYQTSPAILFSCPFPLPPPRSHCTGHGFSLVQLGDVNILFELKSVFEVLHQVCRHFAFMLEFLIVMIDSARVRMPFRRRRVDQIRFYRFQMRKRGDSEFRHESTPKLRILLPRSGYMVPNYILISIRCWY